MTVSKSHIRTALALISFLAAGIFAGPVRAESTKEKLEAARNRVEQLRAEANIATARYDRANERLIVTRDRIAAVRASLQAARGRIGKLKTRLNARAHEAYQMGPTNTLDLLLQAESFSAFSDRLEFLDRLAQDDADLVTRVAVLSEQLRRQEADLARLERIQAAAQREADRQRDLVISKLNQAQSLEEEIEEKYKDELAAARAAAAAATPTGGTGSGSIATVSGQALEACPAPGTSFTDTYGAPRSGGRTHQGVDMMGDYGWPIYAAQTGTVSHSSSDLGGIQAYVYAAGGDVTFYAHLQGYSDASGHVAAGTLIGYMGDTGNATGTPHLHFEYHPGGVVTNPTPYVAAVC